MLSNYKKNFKMTVDIDTRVKSVYKLAKHYPNNEQLQEAVGVVKTLRRSQGQLAFWSEQHKIDKKKLKAEIVTLSRENQELEVQIKLKSENINTLNFELIQIDKQMVKLTQDKQKAIAERDKVIANLKHIQTEVELARMKVQQTQSIYGKLGILWTLIQSLFFSDDPQGFGKIDNSVEYDPNKPQMGTSQSDIGRDLLDK